MDTCKLPQELIDIIIHNFRDDPYTLCSCSLQWLPTSHRHFFYRVVLYHRYNFRHPGDVPYSMRLFRVLLSSPHLANYIRELKVYEGKRHKEQDWIKTDQTLPLVLRRLTKLTIMEFQRLDWDALSLDLKQSICSAFELPSLTSVEIENALFAKMDDFASLLSHTKGLARLSLTDVGFCSAEPLAHEDREAGNEDRSASYQRRHLIDLHLNLSCHSVFVDWLLGARSPSEVSHIHSLHILNLCKLDINVINRLLRAIGSSLKHLRLYEPWNSLYENSINDISIEFNPHIEFLHIGHIQSSGVWTADTMPWFPSFASTIGKSNHLKEIKLEVDYYEGLLDWSRWGAVDSALAGAHFECLRKIDIAVWRETNEREWSREACENLVRGFPLLKAKGVSVNVH